MEKISVFDSSLLKSIHLFFLSKLYTWAGNYRTVVLKKGTSTFVMPQYIPKLMENFDRHLKFTTTEDGLPQNLTILDINWLAIDLNEAFWHYSNQLIRDVGLQEEFAKRWAKEPLLRPI